MGMDRPAFRGQRGMGPKVVALGGGTGLSTMLRGLKQYADKITAMATMAEDGGGSGVLRQDLGMPPPGDIRNCLLALSNTEPVMSELLGYRFTEGILKGQSFGNLFLAALNEISPSFDVAVRRMSEVLAITGRVLPVTNEDVYLEAEFENYTKVVGESKIFQCKKEQGCRIRRIRMLPEHPKALPESLKAIREADLILLGPGSLYTSIIPNLLVSGIVEELMVSDALKLYICNVMTQEGETEGYSAADHIQAIFRHADDKIFDYCLINSRRIPKEICERYAVEGAAPIVCDRGACEKLGVQMIEKPVSVVSEGKVKHDPLALGREIFSIYSEFGAMRIAGEDF